MTTRNYMMIDREGGSSFYQTRAELFADMQGPLDDGLEIGVFEVIFDGKRVSEMVDITEAMIERCAEYVMSQYEDKDDFKWHHSKAPDWLESSNAYEVFMNGGKLPNRNDSWVPA